MALSFEGKESMRATIIWSDRDLRSAEPSKGEG
jgi:hypothetical protein